jgi:hypothetical protein
MDININSKYIVIYIDPEIDKEYEIVKNIINSNNLGIIIFLLNNEEKNYNNNYKSILEIYPDDYTEDKLISNSLFIIYISQFKRSLILQELIQKYNKIIFFKKEQLFNNIDLFMNDKYVVNENYSSEFINYYNNLKEIIHINYNKNIKIELNKKITEINKIESNKNDKIYIVTFYKNFVNNNILNTIQKTCIMQNIKNKDVNKILIIGYNLKNILKNAFEDDFNKIIFYDLTDENKELFSVENSNKINNNIKSLLYLEEICTNEEDAEDVDTEDADAEDVDTEDADAEDVDPDVEDVNPDTKDAEDAEDAKDVDTDTEDVDTEDSDLSISKLINITNNIFNDKIVCIVRSDIIIPNQDNIDYIDLNLELSKKKIFLISRLDRCIDSKILKSQKLVNNLFSTEQDGWLFKTPILLNEESYNFLNNKYFYNKYEHLYLNKILIKNDYYIVNNSIFKILRILSNNNIDNRDLLIEKDIENYNLNDMFLLPDFDTVNNLQFEHLIKISGIDENEVYKMKCYFFNKYLKNKIINNI